VNAISRKPNIDISGEVDSAEKNETPDRPSEKSFFAH
jgi:hypothetical protein